MEGECLKCRFITHLSLIMQSASCLKCTATGLSEGCKKDMRSLWHGLVVNQPLTPRREQTGFPHHNKDTILSRKFR